MRRDSEVIVGLAQPRGAFPHYRRAGDFIFVSGTSSRRKDGSFAGAEWNEEGDLLLNIEAQTLAVIENIGKILAAAGSSLDDVIDITTFLADMADFEAYNRVYGTFFSEDGPARTTVAVRALPHPHLLIEMKAVAYAPLARGQEHV